MIQHLSENPGMLKRPRLHTLIQEGVKNRILVLLAGPGYGKTQAMASYLIKSNTPYLWLRLSALDNLSTHFWSHLMRALMHSYPDLANRLLQFEFPTNLASFENFIRLLSKILCGKEQIIWVFDDFGEINDPQIIAFIKMLADINLENFCIVLLSNTLNHTEAIPFITNKQSLIPTSELRFTQNEIAALYELYDITLEADELHAVEQYTEGWPLPLHMLVLQHNRIPLNMNKGDRLTNQVVSQMFESRFFSNYTTQQQKLLAKLSMLGSFTLGLAMDLYEGERLEAETLKNHVFVISEPIMGRFFFHHLYHLFLKDKQYLLSKQDIQQVWQKAAEYYASIDDSTQAITCYRKAGDHIGMLNVIREYIRLENDITFENAPFFLEHLNLLTPEEIDAHPVSQHLRAIIYLNMLDAENAEKILISTEKKLLNCDTPEARSLLAETYAARGSIHMLMNQEDFGEFYQKAVYYQPEGSHFHNRNRPSTRNNHCFLLPDNLPGAKERMEKVMHEGMPWVQRFLGGSMSGKEHLFSAEAAYLSLNMSEAKQHTYRAIYKAKANAQHDLVCNSHAFLARIGLMEGDFNEMTRQIQEVTAYAETCDNSVINEIRDTALGWYYVKLRDDKRIPKSIYAMNDDSKPMWSYGRSQIVYAIHLIHTQEYARMVGMLEYPKGTFFVQGISPDRITLNIMLAIGYYHLGNTDAALQALWAAYDMSYHNDLAALFIEGGQHMLDLLERASQASCFAFDRDWLHQIEVETHIYIERVATVRAAYRKQNFPKASPNSPLSKRETVVLQSLARGLTREEIAGEQYISVHTVKAAIRSIYTKLNANNRADAVSIAITNGYIEGHTPDILLRV